MTIKGVPSKVIKITERQKKLVQYYLETGNKIESALRAGYSKQSAESLHPYETKFVRKCLDHLKEKQLNDELLSAESIVKLMSDIAIGKTKEEVLIVCDKSIERLEKKPLIKDQLKALELLSKVLGLYKDNNININTMNNITIVDDIT